MPLPTEADQMQMDVGSAGVCVGVCVMYVWCVCVCFAVCICGAQCICGVQCMCGVCVHAHTYAFLSFLLYF